MIFNRHSSLSGLHAPFSPRNSEINNEMYVSPGLKCGNVIARRHADVISQILAELEKLRVEGADSIKLIDRTTNKNYIVYMDNGKLITTEVVE